MVKVIPFGALDDYIKTNKLELGIIKKSDIVSHSTKKFPNAFDDFIIHIKNDHYLNSLAIHEAITSFGVSIVNEDMESFGLRKKIGLIESLRKHILSPSLNPVCNNLKILHVDTVTTKKAIYMSPKTSDSVNTISKELRICFDDVLILCWIRALEHSKYIINIGRVFTDNFSLREEKRGLKILKEINLRLLDDLKSYNEELKIYINYNKFKLIDEEYSDLSAIARLNIEQDLKKMQTLYNEINRSFNSKFRNK